MSFFSSNDQISKLIPSFPFFVFCISNMNISFSDLGKRRRRRPSECRNRVLMLTPGVSIREEREGEEEKKEERREKCGG